MAQIQHLASSPVLDISRPVIGPAIDIANELVIEIDPRAYATFTGSAGQLLEEGLIPSGFNWPVGFQMAKWADGKFSYVLQRRRPSGAKGHRSRFLEVDCWWLRRFQAGYTGCYGEAVVFQKKAELKAALQIGTPEYRRNFDRYMAAADDHRFQSFLALATGQKAGKRGCRGRTENNGGGEYAA